MRKKGMRERMMLPFFTLAVFLFQSPLAGADSHVVINEISTGQEGFVTNEFVELYNPGSTAVVLDGFRLMKKTASGSESNLVSSLKFRGTIEGGNYFLIAHPSYAATVGADIPYSGASYSISSDNTVLLHDKTGKVIDKVGMGKAGDMEKSTASNPAVGKSIGRLGGIDTDDNSADFTAQESTPGKENKKASDIPKTFPHAMRINEIFPYPSQSSYGEYIELYNYSDVDISLTGWELRDASKTGQYVFPSGKSISSRSYLVIFRGEFTFALNNSGSEAVSLFDPSGVLVDMVSYSGAHSDTSYSFDGTNWRWSSFPTPDAQNMFSDAPDGEVRYDDDIYAGVYADFVVSLSSGDLKATWDFGDGHKSYKAVTRHKYEKTGTYAGNVKISGKSEDVIKQFTVHVEDFPHPKVKIVAVNANPKGSDERETITVQNKSRKKVNLNGWSIATSSKKKFINHPIRQDVIIKKGKQKEITREESKFSLNNKKGKIELRYPDGKVASKVKYGDADGVAEGEVYVKVKGGWEWQNTIASISYKVLSMDASKQDAGMQEDADASQGELTEAKIKKKIDLAKFVQGDVMFAGFLETKNNDTQEGYVQERDGIYVFTPEGKMRIHYAARFFWNVFSKANELVNNLLNR